MKTIFRTVPGALAAAFLLSSCGGSSHFGGITGFQGATIRFINGSPSAGSVDVAIGSPTNKLFTGVAADSVYTNTSTGLSGYLGYNQKQSPDVFVYAAGTSTLLNGKTQADGQVATGSVSLAPNSRATIVLVGSGSNTAVIKFDEHIFKTSAGNAGVQFHHAALSLGGTSVVNVGYCASSAISTCATSGTQLGTVTYGLTPLATESLPTSIASSGIGFYVQPQSGSSSALTILPSQVDTTDTNNVMPYSAGAQNGDQNLSIYALDGASGVQLLGIFDPDN